MEKQRISKLMAGRGMCSRREADRYIERGLVLVDGEVVSELGTKVAPDAKIELAEAGRKRQEQQATFLINKPIGYVSAQPEDGHRPASDLLDRPNQWSEDRSQRKFHHGQLRGLAPAGRLDIDSVGLLVLTQDGRVARRIIGEDSDVDKEYLVRVEGDLSDEGLKLLNHGLELDGKPLKPAKVTWQNADQLRFVLREGKKRQIRRMVELVGLKVVGLKRIRIGKVVLGNLPEGQWRYLGDHETF
ncbi:pseudouridine synthase [Pontiellaceae bacterium B1224]|nr:pseudouridine synthase [Pontiellaceae bacterium B1224]